MLRFLTTCALAALILLPFSAQACIGGDGTTDCMDMGDHSANQVKAVGKTMPIPPNSTTGFEAANAAMHKDMMIDFSGNADVDFVRGMIPHHQGAIAMAKVLLTYGKDPELQKLGHDIITAQTKEIAQMTAWLAAHPQK